MPEESVNSHFEKRARQYNRSSNWVHNKELANKIFQLAHTDKSKTVLDLATGTGQIAKCFHGRVKKLIGIDVSEEMTSTNTYLDELIISTAHDMPFEDSTFDAIVCRQGLQFMNLSLALTETKRVLKKGGIVVFAHLTSFGEEDKDDTFLIQKLRNPARANFLLPKHLPNLLETMGFKIQECFNYETKESVQKWINNGSLSQERMDQIFEAYHNASDQFKAAHKIQFIDSDIIDVMNMQIIKAQLNG